MQCGSLCLPLVVRAPDDSPADPSSPAVAGENPGLFLLRKDSERRATLHRVLTNYIATVVAHVQDALPMVPISCSMSVTLLVSRPDDKC